MCIVRTIFLLPISSIRLKLPIKDLCVIKQDHLDHQMQYVGHVQQDHTILKKVMLENLRVILLAFSMHPYNL
jgi:ABC-type ATPase involved in cell division